MRALIAKLLKFADSSLPASWLIHSGGAALLNPLVGGFTVTTFFTLREMEQAAHQTGEPWYDYVLDVAGPFLVSCLWEWLVGWNLAAWLYVLLRSL